MERLDKCDDVEHEFNAGKNISPPSIDTVVGRFPINLGEKFAKKYEVNIEKSTLFFIEDFVNSHEEEVQFKIGPIK